MIKKKDDIWALCFSTDGKYLISGNVDKTFKIWRLNFVKNEFKEIKSIKSHTGDINYTLIKTK